MTAEEKLTQEAMGIARTLFYEALQPMTVEEVRDMMRTHHLIKLRDHQERQLVTYTFSWLMRATRTVVYRMIRDAGMLIDTNDILKIVSGTATLHSHTTSLSTVWAIQILANAMLKFMKCEDTASLVCEAKPKPAGGMVQNLVLDDFYWVIDGTNEKIRGSL